MPMVSWQTFVRLGFDVAQAKGGKFRGIDEGGDFIEGLSVLWNQNKEQLKQRTERQARNYLEERVEA
jgi:hypothetical protein